MSEEKRNEVTEEVKETLELTEEDLEKVNGGGTDPLYVVDGVPTTSGLNTLNSYDFESMQVLKDAASTSIYGTRGAN